MKAFLFILNSIALVFSSSSAAAPQAEEGDAVAQELRILLKELSYIGTDYPEAVRNGKIHKKSEYEEIVGFARSAQKQFFAVKSQLDEQHAEDIERRLKFLSELIESKEAHEKILYTAESLNKDVTWLFKVPVAPQSQPAWGLGRDVFKHHCASCHGAQGHGDGPLGVDLDPPPRDFHDSEVMEISSPFKFYNILLAGIEGTGMASYKGVLSEEELWGVSFFLSGIRYFPEPSAWQDSSVEQFWSQQEESFKTEILEKGLSKTLLAESHDVELVTWLEKNISSFARGDDDFLKLQSLRLGAAFSEQVPLDKGHRDHRGSVDEVLKNIDFSVKNVESAHKFFDMGEIKEAEKALLEAYLFGFQGTEASLSIIDRGIVRDVEKLFMETRGFASAQRREDFDRSTELLKVKLSEAAQIYQDSAENSSSAWGEFLAALIIILREGFEAFLVVASLLAILSSLGEVRARRWVHGGWLSAILMGIITYFVFEKVLSLSGAAKESIEAFCTGIAVILLFYTGFWLLSQAEQKRWTKYVRKSTESALSSGKLYTLFFISFIAVYREAAETVLFYSALYKTADYSFAVSSGFLCGGVLLLGLSWGFISYNIKLPLEKFFKGTSCLMIAIAVILVGKTIQELIEAGYFTATPIAGMPAIDILGVYPSLETLGGQLSLLGLGLALAYFLSWRKKSSKALISSEFQ